MPQTQQAIDRTSSLALSKLDFSKVITRVTCESEALALPTGAAVGDMWGGRTFTDNVAAVLESRSCSGWQELENGTECWTFIVIAR